MLYEFPMGHQFSPSFKMAFALCKLRIPFKLCAMHTVWG